MYLQTQELLGLLQHKPYDQTITWIDLVELIKDYELNVYGTVNPSG